jgi:hypothetical protein
MKRGDIVKYSRPGSPDEAALRFVLLAAPEKHRVDIQLIGEERIKPIETVADAEIELANSNDQTKTSRPAVA